MDYEIDLSTKNANMFRDQLAGFADHARIAGSQQRRPAATSTSTSNRQFSAAVRAWAKQQGVEISDRGRLPSLIVAQYRAATKGGSARRSGAA